MENRRDDSLRVAVLTGGDSAERDISLASGARVAAALEQAGHSVEMIDPAGCEMDTIDWDQFDACFLALHGGAGEDGRIQKWLEDRRIPYTGSNSSASRKAMSKAAAKKLMQQEDVPTAPFALVLEDDSPRQMAAKVAGIGFPLVIKPDGEGSSFGLGVAQSEADLPLRVADSRRYGRLVLAEKLIAGREFTVTVLGRRALPLVEIVAPAGIFDYDSKYVSTTTELHFDTGLPPMKVKELQRTAVAAAVALGTSGLVRVDLILDEKQRPWVLEVNTLPGMTDHSIAPLAAARSGMDMAALCDWMLRDARRTS